MEKSVLLSSGVLRIPCKLSAPEHGAIRRIVLGVHGFGGCADDEIQTGIAEEMSLFHCAVLRFDFPAHGESPMNDGFTLKNCVDTLLAVARYGREQFPEVEDLCIFATGFGAYVTLIALEELRELPGRVKLVVQTPSVRMHETLLSMLNVSKETFWVMEHITVRAPRRPFEVTYRFYEELQAHQALTAHPIPMLILHGEDDAYIRMSDIRRFRQLNERSKLVIIPGTSHQFLEEGSWDMVLDLTRDWFEFEQVLLTDWE